MTAIADGKRRQGQLAGTGRPRTLTVGYLLVFGLAELVLVHVDVVAGFVLHCLLLWMLVNQHLLASRRGEEDASQPEKNPPYLTLALLPLLRILSLTMPVQQVPRILWPAAATAPLVIAMFLLRRAEGSRLRRSDRWRPGRVQVLIAATGLPLGVVAHELLPRSPTLDPWWLSVAALVAVLTGVVEEALFRGFLQGALCRQFGRYGILLTSAASGAAHVGTRSPAMVCFSAVAALLFGWMAERSRSVVGVAVAHGVLNLIVVLPNR